MWVRHLESYLAVLIWTWYHLCYFVRLTSMLQKKKKNQFEPFSGTFDYNDATLVIMQLLFIGIWLLVTRTRDYSLRRRLYIIFKYAWNPFRHIAYGLRECDSVRNKHRRGSYVTRSRINNTATIRDRLGYSLLSFVVTLTTAPGPIKSWRTRPSWLYYLFCFRYYYYYHQCTYELIYIYISVLTICYWYP